MDFYCLWSLQKSILKLIFDSSKFKYRLIGGYAKSVFLMKECSICHLCYNLWAYCICLLFLWSYLSFSLQNVHLIPYPITLLSFPIFGLLPPENRALYFWTVNQDFLLGDQKTSYLIFQYILIFDFEASCISAFYKKVVFRNLNWEGQLFWNIFS